MPFSLGGDAASPSILRPSSDKHHGICNTNIVITAPSQRDNRVESNGYNLVSQQRSRHSY